MGSVAIPSGGGTAEVILIGKVHTNSTATQTITIPNKEKKIIVTRNQSNASGTLTVSNNKSLLPTSIVSDGTTHIDIYENVPSGTVFTIKISQGYWYDVDILAVR